MMDIAPWLKEEYSGQALRWLPEKVVSQLKIHLDTTDFFKLEYGDIVILNQTPYLILHNAKEGRFGLDEEVKHWVKRGVELKTGNAKIIKLVFHEAFKCTIGSSLFHCFRSPRKEARILKLAAGHPNFMQGFGVYDAKGNVVRVIDHIYGSTLAAHIDDIKAGHETYYFNLFPQVLAEYMECIRAIHFLHEHNEKHGDIRRDHILIDRQTGRYRWIDFDYNYMHRENIYSYDLFGLGNILIFLVGKGDVLLMDLRDRNHPALTGLCEEDLNIVFNNRVANLRKVYPYLPEVLNKILLHFSRGANYFYQNTGQLIEDLEAYRAQSN
jgi:hypothetical protein